MSNKGAILNKRMQRRIAIANALRGKDWTDPRYIGVAAGVDLSTLNTELRAMIDNGHIERKSSGFRKDKAQSVFQYRLKPPPSANP